MVEEKIYAKPSTVEEAALIALQNAGNFKFLAGGTDLIINKFQGNDTATCWIDLSGIEELKGVERKKKYLHIGALTTLEELQSCQWVKDEFPIVLVAARAVASPVIRKTATLGGNLLCENRCAFYNQSAWWRQAVGYCLKCKGDVCIATGGDKNCFSKFSSDMAVALISLDACVEVIDGKEGYVARLEELYTGDGVKPRKFSKTAILRSILLPLDQEFRSVFKKLRQRESLEFSSLSTAVSVNKNNKLKMVAGSVDPRPIVMEGIPEEAHELARKTIKKARIVDNDVYSRPYRKEMMAVFLRNSLKELLID